MSERITLFKACENALQNGVSLYKAATDFEIGGALTITDAGNFWDTVIQQTNYISRIFRYDQFSIIAHLNQFVNQGVIVGKPDAATAAAAVRAGNDVANIVKDNIGNDLTLKELYYLYNFNSAELVNFARLGRGVFASRATAQLMADFGEKMEAHLFNGDGTANQPDGIIVTAKANLNATVDTQSATGKDVAFTDTTALTTVTDALSAVLDLQQDKYEDDSVIFLSNNDYKTYKREVDASSNFNGARTRTEKRDYDFEGIELLPSSHMTDKEYLITPLNNVVFANKVDGMETNVDVQNVPKSTLYNTMGHWNFGFITYDKVTLGYQVP